MTVEQYESEALLKELLGMDDDAKRIQVVADDVRSRADHFRGISPHDLAEALGVPQPDCPADWENICSAEILTLEERELDLDEFSFLVYIIRDKVDPGRLAIITNEAEELDKAGSTQFDFLTKEEKHLIEVALAERDLKGKLENGIGTVALYSVGEGEDNLRFEGTIEDDGHCIVLLTPYDFRDGKFKDFSNCVTAFS
jgi:hypothetical protein